MGEEVYAKSVADVEAKLTIMDQELEEWQLGIKRHPEMESRIAALETKLAQRVPDERAAFEKWFAPYRRGHQSDLAAWSGWEARAALAAAPAAIEQRAPVAQASNAQQAEPFCASKPDESESQGSLRAVGLHQDAEQRAEAQEPVYGQSRFIDGRWASCSVEHVRMVQANHQNWRGYEVRLLFTRPQPEQLQALSEEEATTAWRGVKDVGDDKLNAILLGEAIQSALAAKNGAGLV